MKVLIPGHRYELENFEHEALVNKKGQELQFIQKELDRLGNFVTVSNGTTNEEVLKVLIDRMQSLNAKMASRENAIVITHLETALLWLEKRTRDRQARGVEGTPKP